MPIGIPPVCDVEPDVYAVTKLGAALLVRPKTERDHKRSVGTVLVLGGSAGMAGAAHMAAMGALRSGAGLVHCALPAGETRDKPFLEVITVPLPDKAAIGPASLAAARAEMKAMKATALGPGMGRDEQSVTFARQIVAEKVPLVIDADGLYALGTDLDLLIERKAPTVLTPHEGELARLLDTTVAEVSARRLAAARQAAALSGATVLLKGSLTIVADPSGRAYVVATGNPGLATPGTGDVLTGCIVAQLAKGLDATRRRLSGRLPPRPRRRPGRRAGGRHRRADRRRPVRLPSARPREPDRGRRRARSRPRSRRVRTTCPTTTPPPPPLPTRPSPTSWSARWSRSVPTPPCTSS